MINLFTLLASLQQRPRRLAPREILYVDQLLDQIVHAENHAARWRILEREGLSRTNLDQLAALRYTASQPTEQRQCYCKGWR